jgi:hypothetical protein
MHGLENVQRDYYNQSNEAFRDEGKQSNELRRRGKDDEADKLDAKIAEDQARLLKTKIDTFGKQYTAAVDLEVIDLWTQMHAHDRSGYKEGTDYVAMRKKMVLAQKRLNQLIGTWPGESHLPEGQQKIWLGTSRAFEQERVVHVTLNQRTPSVAVPKVVGWLKLQGATVNGASFGAGSDWMLKAATQPSEEDEADTE